MIDRAMLEMAARITRDHGVVGVVVTSEVAYDELHGPLMRFEFRCRDKVHFTGVTMDNLEDQTPEQLREYVVQMADTFRETVQ